jgi:hypothetical protein
MTSKAANTQTEFSLFPNVSIPQRNSASQWLWHSYDLTRSKAASAVRKIFGKEKFDPYHDEEPKTKSGDEKDQGSAPKKIEGLGDDTYWVGNRFGVLYVLKGDAFISVGLGGTDDEDTKLKKSKVLAQKALQRL